MKVQSVCRTYIKKQMIAELFGRVGKVKVKENYS